MSWNEALGGVGNFMHQEVALRALILVKKLWSRQTDRQANWLAGRHKDRQIDKPKDRRVAERQTNPLTNFRTDWLTG